MSFFFFVADHNPLLYREASTLDNNYGIFQIVARWDEMRIIMQVVEPTLDRPACGKQLKSTKKEHCQISALSD